jgi:hypothetical protein
MDAHGDFKAQRLAEHNRTARQSGGARRGAARHGQLHALPGRLRGWRERWLDGLGLPRDGGFAVGADPLRWSDDAHSSQQRVITFRQRASLDQDDDPYSA